MKHTTEQRARRAALAQKNASPRQRAELARRKRMGVGLIEKPLRLIGNRTNTVAHDAKGNLVTVLSDEYKMARWYANEGYGKGVRAMAFAQVWS